MKSVAIEREFGSGGRDIGIRIAKEAQIPYYDGQLLIEAAKGYGIEIATLKEFDENKVGSFLYNIAMMAGDNQYENMAKINEIFYGMKETIKNLHAEGPAVFIGRCSTEILKSHPFPAQNRFLRGRLTPEFAQKVRECSCRFSARHARRWRLRRPAGRTFCRRCGWC